MGRCSLFYTEKNEGVRVRYMDPLIHSAEKGNGYARMTCVFLGVSKGPQIFHGCGD